MSISPHAFAPTSTFPPCGVRSRPSSIATLRYGIRAADETFYDSGCYKFGNEADTRCNAGKAAYGYVDMGGWVGGQAEYVMVPYADFNLLKFSNREKAMSKIADLTLLFAPSFLFGDGRDHRRHHPQIAARSGPRLSGRSSARSVVLHAIIPQPMSTPTAAIRPICILFIGAVSRFANPVRLRALKRQNLKLG